MINQLQEQTTENTQASGNRDNTIVKDELPQLSAGMLADLCRIHQQIMVDTEEEKEEDNDIKGNTKHSNKNNVIMPVPVVDMYYLPLDANTMPSDAAPPTIETKNAHYCIDNLLHELEAFRLP
jgi:hypothetical protein